MQGSGLKMPRHLIVMNKRNEEKNPMYETKMENIE